MSEMVNCDNCGASVPIAHRFCGTCGSRMPEPPSVIEQSDGERVSQEKPRPQAHLVRIHGGGTDGEVYPLSEQRQVIGRTEGQIRFPDDPFVSPQHASFYRDGERFFVRDEGSLNGVFCRISGTVPLDNGDTFMAGEEVIRVELGDPGGLVIDPENTHFFGSPRPTDIAFFRVRQILEGGDNGLCHYGTGGPITVGREGTVLEFPNDRFISGRHCSVELVNGEPQLTDLSSRNGTFVRLKEVRELRHRDFIFIGRQLLRIDIFDGSPAGGAL